MTKVNLGSFKVDALSQEEVIIQIKSKILKSVEPNIMVTPNAGHLPNIFNNPELSKIDSNGVGVLLLMGIDKTKLGYKLGTIKFSID